MRVYSLTKENVVHCEIGCRYIDAECIGVYCSKEVAYCAIHTEANVLNNESGDKSFYVDSILEEGRFQIVHKDTRKAVARYTIKLHILDEHVWDNGLIR